MKKNHWFDHLVDVMCSLHDSTGIAIDDFGLDPMPGSIASIELDASDDSELVLAAYSQGSLMIQVVMDHYNSLARAITQPVLTISPWTTIRSLMEASAIGIWLLSVSIDINERISRSLKFRCEGLLQQKKFGRVLGTNSEVKAITHRHQEVLLKAKVELPNGTVITIEGS